MSIEFWRVAVPKLDGFAEQAKRIESQGWDGLAMGDTQNIAPETYVCMTVAMAATSHLKLCTWVTNPVTRHPAVAAAAAATIQAFSGGRVEVGIGRGASAHAFLGLAPAPLTYFENYVERLRGYLHGADVPMDATTDGKDGTIATSDTVSAGERPTASSLKWLPEGHTPVPVIVAASGPRVMAVGARIADGVTAVVGADAARLTWARNEILAARTRAGLPSAGFTIGASCVLAVSDDIDVARSIARPFTATQAHLAVMHNRVSGPTSEILDKGLRAVHDTYNMNLHAQEGAEHNRTTPDALVDSFAIAGPVNYCVERLLEIASLGFTRLTLSVEAPDADPAAVRRSHDLLAEQVLPAVRRNVHDPDRCGTRDTGGLPRYAR